MAPKEVFPDKPAAWISSLFPEYDTKLAINKPRIFGQPEPQDDTDLSAWKQRRLKEFETKFGPELNCVPQWRVKFMCKFANRTRTVKNNIKDTLFKTSGATSDRKILHEEPFIVIEEESKTTGRKLFEEQNTKIFSEEATKRRGRLGQTSHDHPGHWRSIATDAWKSLTDTERGEWDEKARVIDADNSRTAMGNIYESQGALLLRAYNLLSGAIGSRSYQVGSAAFHLLYAFRNADDVLQLGKLQIVDTDIIDSQFDDDVKDYVDRISKPWTQYCHKSVRSNRTAIEECETFFSKNKDRHYILPSFDEENGKISDLRKALKLFIEGSWNQVWPRSPAMPSLPWADFIENPIEYIHPSISLAGISIARPDIMNAQDLRKLSERLVEFQSTFPDSTLIFQSCPEISIHRDRRQALVDGEEFDQLEPNEIMHEPNTSPPISPQKQNPQAVVSLGLSPEIRQDREASRVSTGPRPAAPIPTLAQPIPETKDMPIGAQNIPIDPVLLVHNSATTRTSDFNHARGGTSSLGHGNGRHGSEKEVAAPTSLSNPTLTQPDSNEVDMHNMHTPMTQALPAALTVINPLSESVPSSSSAGKAASDSVNPISSGRSSGRGRGRGRGRGMRGRHEKGVAAPTRASVRALMPAEAAGAKRTFDTVESSTNGPPPAGPKKKPKAKHTWWLVDEYGNYTDQHGHPIDKMGNLLPQAG